MAINAFEIIGEISLEGGRLVIRQLGEVDDQLHRVGNSAKETKGGFTIMRGAMANLVSAGITRLGELAKTVVSTGIGYNSMLESSTVAWTTLLGSEKAAKDMLNTIVQLAKKTQFNTENVDKMAKYMHNAGYEGKGLVEQINKVADVSGAFNIGADDAVEMARQMSQVQQAGRAMTEDLNILGDRGVPILDALAKQMKVSKGEVLKMAGQGKISAKDYAASFDAIAASVKGSADKQSKTWAGMKSTVEDQMSAIAGVLSKPIFDVLEKALANFSKNLDIWQPKIQMFIDYLSGKKGHADAEKVLGKDFMKAMDDVQGAWQWIVDNKDTIIAAIAGIAGAFAAFKILTTINALYETYIALMVAFRTGTVLATLAQLGFNVALLANPLTWWAVGIGVAIAAGYLLIKNWASVKEWFINVWGWIKDEFMKYGAILVGASGPFGLMIAAGAALWKNWATIKSKAIQIWGSMVDTIKSKLGELKKAYENSLLGKAVGGISGAVGWVGGKLGLNAKGGYFDKPSIMNVAGEAGKEVLIPLENRRNMAPFAKAVADNLGGMVAPAKSTPTSLEIPVMVGDRELVRAIIPNLDLELAKRAKRQGSLINRGNL